MWRVRLGDELNGYQAEETLNTLSDATEWPRRKAIETDPESDFGRIIGTGLSEGPKHCHDGPTTDYIDTVFDAPPGPADEPRFREVEDPSGRSIRVREWIHRADGGWVLRIREIATVPFEEFENDDNERHAERPGFV